MESPAERAVPGRQVRCRFAAGNLDYWLFLPKGDEAPGRPPWPVLVFLHGLGERGRPGHRTEDLDRVKRHGPPALAEMDPAFPFIVVSPQLLEPAQRWDPVPLTGLVDRIAAWERVDRRRIYLTGLSMGGAGAWDLAAALPGRFAAVVAICPTIAADPARADRLKDTPTWIFHNLRDPTPATPARHGVALFQALEAAGGTAGLTVYPRDGHDAWTETFADPRLYAWLLEQRRLPPPLPGLGP